MSYYEVWWLQGDHEQCVGRFATLEKAERHQHWLYAVRDLRGDKRFAYDCDFEIR